MNQCSICFKTNRDVRYREKMQCLACPKCVERWNDHNRQFRYNIPGVG